MIIALFGRFVFFADRPRRQPDLFLRRIELEYLERKDLPDLDRVFGLFDSVVAQLGDVTEPFDPLFNFDEGAEVGESNDLALNDVARPVSLEESIPGIWLEIFDRQAQPSAVHVDVGYHRIDLLTLL